MKQTASNSLIFLYVPSLIMDVPLFYWGYFQLQAGLFKVICTNGMMDCVRSSEIRFNMKKSNVDILSAIITNSANVISQVGNPYNQFLTYLHEKKSDVMQARALLPEIAEHTKLPKTVLKWSEQHFDRIESGREVPPASPNKIESDYQVLDTLTYHAQRLPSLGTQNTAERETFSFFYDRFSSDMREGWSASVEADGVGPASHVINGINVKSLMHSADVAAAGAAQ